MFPIRDHNPSERVPFVTVSLIVLNFLVFFAYYSALSQAQMAAFFYEWGMVPGYISAGRNLHGILTHMFLHEGWMHLLGNMLFLYIFGDNLEDKLGHAGFALFYLACGLAAAALQYSADPLSQVPMIGASGAISGVMGGYLLLFPKARVDVLFIFVVFFRVFAIPAWVVLGLWFAVQVLSGTGPSDGGGVAYLAHVGGFVAGLALILRPWLRLGGTAFWQTSGGKPDFPAANYPFAKSHIPQVPRRRP